MTANIGVPSAEARLAAWDDALAADSVPAFVTARLKAASQGKLPWLSTMTPVELRISTTHGIRPIAMVSGTCWHYHGYSWTLGHSVGWHQAIERMRGEALAAGANAIVDVKLRTIRLETGNSMDFTVIGTAVRIDGLPPSIDPVIETVPALEFIRC